MTAVEATKGLPDWAKLFLPMACALLLTGGGWAIQWGQMSEARRQDQEALRALLAQVTTLSSQLQGYATATATMQQMQRADDRRIVALESEISGGRAVASAIAGQIGEMRAELRSLSAEQRRLSNILEGRPRGAL